jgi:hypothetical protein
MGYKIIRPRRGIKSLWDAYKNKVYKSGEMLVESPESGVGSGPVNVKFGDGITPYYLLPYAIEAPINQAIEGSTKPITSGAVYEQNKKLNNNFNEMSDVIDLEKQTQPYIVQKDGLLKATLNSSTTQWSYGNISINGIIRGQVQNVSNSATAMAVTFEVYKGDVLTWESGSGGSVFLGISYRK